MIIPINGDYDMKVGFSFGFCVNDILKGHVDLDDVMVIQCGTYMKEEAHVIEVIQSYIQMGRIDGNYDEAVKIGLALWNSGRLIQPRLYGGSNTIVASQGYHWMDLTPSPLSTDENVKRAWRDYQVMLRLSGD